MKHLFGKVFVMCVLVLLVSCSSDDEKDNKELLFECMVNGSYKTYMSSKAFYNPVDNVTMLEGFATTVGKISIAWEGKKMASGKIVSKDRPNTYIYFWEDNGVIPSLGAPKKYKATTFEYTIKKYGSVGDLIQGEFSATAYNTIDNAAIKITKGKFTIQRMADMEPVFTPNYYFSCLINNVSKTFIINKAEYSAADNATLIEGYSSINGTIMLSLPTDAITEGTVKGSGENAYIQFIENGSYDTLSTNSFNYAISKYDDGVVMGSFSGNASGTTKTAIVTQLIPVEGAAVAEGEVAPPAVYLTQDSLVVEEVPEYIIGITGGSFSVNLP